MKQSYPINRSSNSSISINRQLNEKDNRLSTEEVNIEELSNRPLTRIFTSPSSARLVDFFIAYREFDYSEVDIARKNSLSQKTVSKELENLLREEIIKITRKSGRSIMYKLNEEKITSGLVSYVNNKIDQAKRSL